MFTKSPLILCVIAICSASGQTANDLASRYRPVSAYEVRPGVLMTANYEADGQVCEMVLQRRYMPDQTDADSIIALKVENELIDELVPEAERGPATNQKSWKSFSAGGVIHSERDFANVLVVIDGTYWCSDEAGGKANCGHGGTKVITIQWKNRTCASSKAAALASKK